MTLPLPRDTRNASSQNNQVKNPGLLFDRFLNIGHESKGELAKICSSMNKIDQDLERSFVERWEHAANKYHANTFCLSTDWRFLTGVGEQATFEVGFKFNLYGFPYLPGSGVKGVARTWAFMNLVEQFKLDQSQWKLLAENLELDTKDVPYEEWLKKHYPNVSSEVMKQAIDFRIIFGTMGEAGHAIFFDAIPKQAPVLNVDILNPHFSKYYQNKNEPPKDNDRPIMVFFLTVAPNVSFNFAVGWRGTRTLSKEQERLRDLAKKWLEEGLIKLGAGAKTASGYGYFKQDVNQPSNAALEFADFLTNRQEFSQED